MEREIQRALPASMYKKFFHTQMKKLNRIYDLQLRTAKNKLRRLQEEQQPTHCSETSNLVWFKNLTTKEIPEEVKEVVSLGNKFNITNNKVTTQDKVEVIKNVENNLFKLPPESHNEVRQNVTHVINNCMTKQKKMRHIPYHQKRLENNLKTTQEFMQDNQDVMFTIADKGNVTVALDKSTYISEVELLLSDTNTYQPITKDPTMDVIDKLKALLNRWTESTKNYIDDKQKKDLYLTSANLARAYALPKIHKPNNPFRIIVSSIGSPLHHFAAFLKRILNLGLDEPNYTTKNSLEFVNSIQGIDVPSDHCLISLDVSSLFTSIPTDLILQGVKAKWNIIQEKCKIPWEEIVIAVNLIINSTFFSFNGKFYHQVDGTPMGSPISPTFAEYTVRQLENHCLSVLDFKPIFYCRYVDDIFTIIPKNKVEHMLTVFNNYHEKLKFTYEMEVDNSISFLDVKVTRVEEKLKTNWYRKPTYSGRLLHYHSNNPISQKKAIVYNLVDKAVLLSDPTYHSENINIIKEILKQNSYPIKFINQNIKKRFTHLRHNNNNSPSVEETDTDRNFIVLPYHSLLSKNFLDILEALIFKLFLKITTNLISLLRRERINCQFLDSTTSFIVYNVKIVRQGMLDKL